MRITDVEVIEFQTTATGRPSRWSYGVATDRPVETTATLTRIATDEGIDGYMLGGGSVERARSRRGPSGPFCVSTCRRRCSCAR